MNSLDPRLRVVTACIFAILAATSENFCALGFSLLVSILLLFFAGLLHWQTFRRFIELNVFILFLLIFLPLSFPGEPLFHLGGLEWSTEGVIKTAQIALKANSIMLAFVALISTMEPIYFGTALNSLGFPDKLTQILFFAVRYFEVIHKEYLRLRNAMKLRGFRPGFNRHTFTSYGYLVGMLLVRSLDRSERIFQAMKCRGFRNHFYSLTAFQLTRNDVWFIALFVIVVLMILSRGISF